MDGNSILGRENPQLRHFKCGICPACGQHMASVKFIDYRTLCVWDNLHNVVSRVPHKPMVWEAVSTDDIVTSCARAEAVHTETYGTGLGVASPIEDNVGKRL